MLNYNNFRELKALSLRETFTGRLREAIESSEFSQRKFADAVNVHISTVRKWVTGESFPPPEKLEEICKILNVSAPWLLGGPLQTESEKLRDELIGLIKQISNQPTLEELAVLARVFVEEEAKAIKLFGNNKAK